MTGADSFHSALAVRLAAWYEECKRDLPWRRTRDPYAILVSEAMLQQTQAERVRDYYSRWLERFPDFAALAAASEDEAVAQWQGLGYYSRARSLRKTAQWLAQNGYSSLPPKPEILKKLPGLGPYTVGAVCSIAFNMPVPAVDGNVRRVFSRLFALETDPASPKCAARIAANVEAVLRLGEPRVLTQVFMDLGALLCTPGTSVKCAQCPVSGVCAAFAAGIQARLPVSSKKEPIRRRAGAALLIGTPHDGFLLRRRPASGLWARFYEIPWQTAEEGESAERCFLRLAAGLDTARPPCRDTQMEETLKFTRWQVRVRLWATPVLPETAGEYSLHTPGEIEKLPMPAGIKRLALAEIRAQAR